MKLNRSLLTLLLVFGLLCYNTVAINGQKMSLDEVADVIQNVNKCGIVFRVPTNSVKLAYYNNQLRSGDLTVKQEASIKKIILETEAENDEFLNIIKEGFKLNFRFSQVHYVPDTMYKKMLAAKGKMFFDYDTKEVISDLSTCKQLLAILPGTDKNELTLHYLDGRKVDRPLPYQKKTFMSAFKKIFKRKAYLQDQITWFNDQLYIINVSD